MAKRLLLSTLAVHGCGLLTVLLVAGLLLELTPGRLPELYALSPLAMLVFGILWWATMRRRLAESTSGQGVAAYRAAVAFPYVGAAAGLATWAVAEVALAAMGALVWGLPTFSWAALVLGAFAVSFGVAVYQSVWHRRILYSRVGALSESLDDPAAEATEARFPLRFRLTVPLTGLIFFACGFALFTSYARNSQLVGQLMEAKAKVGLERVIRTVEGGGATEVEGEIIIVPKGQPAPAALGPVPAARAGSLPAATDRRVGAYQRRADGTLVAVLVARPARARRDLWVLVGLMSLVFLFAAGMVYLTSVDLGRPVMELAARAEQMAGGDLSRPVGITEADEIGVLAASFERMRTALRDKIATIEALNVGLEDEVRKRTAELEEALEALKQSQAHLVQSEKMASLGQLVAGVAHEINNPVNALVNVLGPMEEIINEIASGEDAEDLADMLRVLRNGTERTRRIVADLKTFSRLDEAELKRVDLLEGLEATLHLVRNTLPEGVSVALESEAAPPIPCFPGPLNQVFVNLLTNAVQAVGEEGEVRIRLGATEDEITVEVEDDGGGIPPELVTRIFDPFFTTKEPGEGTGLGLSISHDIVARHGGRIDVESEVGRGTTMRVRLPMAGPPATSR